MRTEADRQLDALARLVARGGVVALTGAGISTESGIPDYRGPTGRSRAAAPMTIQAFTSGVESRRRYWARSHVGWARMSAAAPNDGHRALAVLEQQGLVTGLITQNVDGLHQAAGSDRVVDLHGRLDRVVCLDCGMVMAREEHRDRLAAANDGWQPQTGAAQPDGDMDVDEASVAQFVVVDCPRCDGVLKPDVVYFGESVPPARVERALAMIDEAAAVLVLGTSLTVYSGRRLVVRAAGNGAPIAVVNQGPTRADDLAQVRIDAPLGAVLMALARQVVAAGASRD